MVAHNNSGTFVSIYMPVVEKEALDAAVKRSGMTRSGWIRELIAKAVSDAE